MKYKLKKNIKQNMNPVYHKQESCRNPWNGECEKTEIMLYIFYKGERLPICEHCWNDIAKKDFEWE